VDRRVTVACVQAEPVVLRREATLDKLAALTAEAAAAGAELVVFPETFVPAYPSSRWARAFAGWADPRAKAAFASLARESVAVPGPDADRLGEIAREHGVWLVTGVNELDPARPGTLYNSLLYHAPDGTLALHHRKLVPTNHERLVWGQGDGRGLETVATELGRIGGLICWENYMPLARFALYAQGVDLYIAPTWDHGDTWVTSMKHIAREGRTWVLGNALCMQGKDVPAGFPERGMVYPDPDEWLNPGDSVVVDPTGKVVAGPMHQERGILYATCDLAEVATARRTLDVVGHYNRPDVFHLEVNHSASAPAHFTDRNG